MGCGPERVGSIFDLDVEEIVDGSMGRWVDVYLYGVDGMDVL
jgi:hypothetical protein